MTEAIAVQELGRTITFSFDDMLKYHGPGSPGGVAVAFKALQRAFEVLSPGEPPARRSIVVRTPFRGPGARDGFEAVTRAVSVVASFSSEPGTRDSEASSRSASQVCSSTALVRLPL